jgi:hypothetical protein
VAGKAREGWLDALIAENTVMAIRVVMAVDIPVIREIDRLAFSLMIPTRTLPNKS